MDFFTPFQLLKSNISIDYNSKIFSIGSCFAENIGAILQENKFNCLINPFGILFHPLAIERNFKQIIHQNLIAENEILFFNDQYLSLHSHSSLNKIDKDNYILNYNNKIKESHHFLKNATHILITFGTSWVYKYLKTNEIVANCQKIPQSEFQKKLLTVEEIKKSIEKTIETLKKFNSNLEIIFTISPVRHLKDGFLENTQSKAHLITALYEVVKNENKTSIFPAYEILLDELRDYRFYKNDYLHPNDLAISYIWGKFQFVYFSDATKVILNKVIQINKDLQHKPFNDNTENRQKFLNQLQQKMINLAKENPTIKF